MEEVWVFNGTRNRFPSAVFTTREQAEAWINTESLEGTLTCYPVGVSVYDWAIQNELFRPKLPKHNTSDFIANFRSASQEHYHYGPE